MDQLALNNIEMNNSTQENEESDPVEDQLLSNNAETGETPENRQQNLQSRLRNWCRAMKAIPLKWKITCGVLAIIVTIVAGAIIACAAPKRHSPVDSNGNETFHNSFHNSSLEGGKEKATDNTTADCRNNKMEYHLCSSCISDCVNGSFSTSLPGRFIYTNCTLDEREQLIYFIAAWKVTWSEAKRFCRDRKGQLFTIKDQRTLETIQSIIPGNFSYWFMASCMPLGSCIQTDNSTFDPTHYGVIPRKNVKSCGALEDGRVRFEMCTNSKRFICAFEP